MAAIVTCPTCGRKSEYSSANQWRPFCSERCKTVDLGAWASNAYVIGGSPQEDNTSSDGPGGDDQLPSADLPAPRSRQ